MNFNKNRERIRLDSSVLMLIDIQEKLFPFIANKEDVLKNNQILLDGAKALGLQTVVTEQYPEGLGPTVEGLQSKIQGLDLWQKRSFSVAIDNSGEIDALVKSGKDTFLLSGIESHICVYQTAKDLLLRGLRVCLIYDACGSRKTENHLQILSTLRELGALILPTESVLFELMSDSKHPSFRTVSGLVK